MDNTKLVRAMGLFGLTATLAACGGGGGGGGGSAPPPPAPQTQTMQGVVANAGPLQGATACYDLNDNKSCDTGEPSSAASDADGKFSLTVPIAEAGKHATKVDVPATAVDKDTGTAIGTAVVLTTPPTGAATGALFVSPMTTVVQHVATSLGISPSEAAAQVKGQLQLTGSPLDNFISSGDAQAARTGRVLMSMQVHLREWANAAGVSADKTQALVNATLSASLSRTATMLSSEPTPSGVAEEVLEAQNVFEHNVAERAERAYLIATAPQEPQSPTPTAGGSLRWFTYTDATHWYYRMFTSTADQNTPVENKTVFVDERKRNRGTAVETFGEPGFAPSAVHWNGSTWFVCPANFEHQQTVRNAQGVGEAFYCGVFHSRSTNTGIDITGKSFSEVIQTIRSHGGRDAEGTYAQWGPDPALPALAGAVFPEGSKLRYVTSTDLVNPQSYFPAFGEIFSYFAPAASGQQAECLAINPTTFTDYGAPALTLEQMIEGARGMPCIYTPTEQSGPRQEWWGNSTVGVDLYTGPTPANPYYQATRDLRASFGPGQSVAYWDCARRASDGSPRNCDPVSTGTYTVENLGDARMLRLHDVPAEWNRMVFVRSYVQRGDRVYLGSRAKLDTDDSLRLNQPATQALFERLGVPLP